MQVSFVRTFGDMIMSFRNVAFAMSVRHARGTVSVGYMEQEVQREAQSLERGDSD